MTCRSDSSADLRWKHRRGPAENDSLLSDDRQIALSRSYRRTEYGRDLEYDPSAYPKLIQPILDVKADVVYGSRFLGYPRRVLFFCHGVGNGFLTLVSDLNLTDMESGYKVFRTDVIKSAHLGCDRFRFEPEITAKIALGVEGSTRFRFPILGERWE